MLVLFSEQVRWISFHLRVLATYCRLPLSGHRKRTFLKLATTVRTLGLCTSYEDRSRAPVADSGTSCAVWQRSLARILNTTWLVMIMCVDFSIEDVQPVTSFTLAGVLNTVSDVL